MTESLTKTYSVFQKTFAGVRRRTALFYIYRWPKNTFEWPRVFLDVISPHIFGGYQFSDPYFNDRKCRLFDVTICAKLPAKDI